MRMDTSSPIRHLDSLDDLDASHSAQWNVGFGEFHSDERARQPGFIRANVRYVRVSQRRSVPALCFKRDYGRCRSRHRSPASGSRSIRRNEFFASVSSRNTCSSERTAESMMMSYYKSLVSSNCTVYEKENLDGVSQRNSWNKRCCVSGRRTRCAF